MKGRKREIICYYFFERKRFFLRIKKEKKNKRFGVRKVEEKGKGIRVEV